MTSRSDLRDSRRLDGPHLSLATGDRDPLDITASELERHALELGEHLRRQQASLDHREALIHSQLADLESQRRRLRAIRADRDSSSMADEGGDDDNPMHDVDDAAHVLPMSTARAPEHDPVGALREHELERREAALDAFAAKVEREAAETVTARRLLESQAADLQRREEQLGQQTEAERLDREEQQSELCRRADSLADAEQLLSEQCRIAEVEREQLARERAAFAKECQHAQADFAEQQRAFEAQWERRRRQLQAEAERNHRHAQAQSEVRRELTTMHREMLELGIALQEIWSDLARRVPLPALANSLLHLRAQLADTYRLERDALASERQQLQSLAHRLAEHKRGLERRRNELHHWAARRSTEFEEQAAQLVARQHELSRREADFNNERQEWAHRRRELESRFRELIA
ncbi:MAG: hypothetical protein KDB14_34585 [Planctomycetales bacterium]|nr:hypothetical protein [Planctomycetales bacterium]